MLKNTILITISIVLTLFINFYLTNPAISEQSQIPKECNDGQVSTLSGDYTKTGTWNCPPKTPLEFDDENTPDEIESGSGVSVYVTGGNSPYIWGNPGNGYSWDSGTTTFVKSNTLRCVTGT